MGRPYTCSADDRMPEARDKLAVLGRIVNTATEVSYHHHVTLLIPSGVICSYPKLSHWLFSRFLIQLIGFGDFASALFIHNSTGEGFTSCVSGGPYSQFRIPTVL